ncbi:hypothetical protein BOX15_Mlig027341g1 [Macrostomum lignano]|uniref:Cyclic nucleotide-binding domain-containing protein n=2 Tax=Macrostomum lignano TaxID=282301 RepID=A0A267GYH0_9PLAT|nr:hypothetical protein BOX15_Mlig027341g1 [Macrostomum lignano]
MSLSHIVQCISKSASERSDSEVIELVDWFLNMCPLNIKPDVARDILRNCAFRQCQRDDVIIRQGEQGDSFYIILDGKVSVYINTEAVLDDPDDEATTTGGEEAAQAAVNATAAQPEQSQGPVSVSSLKRKASKGGTSAAIAAATAEKKELDRTKYGNFIVNFGAGKSFGELALINKDCVRNASIIADEPTLLIEVNRDLYNRSLRSVQEAELRERFEFVSRCNVFDSWPSKYRRQAAMSLRKENFGFDATIVRQGDPLDGLQFIVSGQAKVVVNIPMHPGQYPLLGLREFHFGSDEQPPTGSSQDRHHRAQTTPHRRVQHQQRHLELSLVGPGELIGDIEHGMELPTYAQSIVCTQPSVVFVLDAKNYDRLAQNKRNPGRSQDVLVERAKAKLISRAGRPLDWGVPLIRCLYERIVAARRLEAHRREVAASAAAAPSYAVKSASVSHFIPSRGALIDPYGPGTVFYRNRVKREQRAAQAARLTASTKQIKTKDLQQQGNKKTAELAAPDGSSSKLPLGEEEEEQEEDEQKEEAAEQSSFNNLSNQLRQRKQFEDADTSSERLSNLESRIDNWLRSVDGTKAGVPARPVTVMNRFRNEDDHKIHPGRRVCLRPRRLPITRLTTAFSGLLGAGHGGDDENEGREEDDHEDPEIFITEQQVDEVAVGGSFVSFAGDGQRSHDSRLNEADGGRRSTLRHSQPARPQLLHPGAVHRAQSSSPTVGAAAGQTAPPTKPEGAATAGSGRRQQLPSLLDSPEHHRSSQMWRSAAASAAESALTPAERRENTAAVLKEILSNQTLPEDVKATLMDLQKMSNVLPDLDSRQFGSGRAKKAAPRGTVGLGGVCYRCRRHHLASSLT